MNIFCARFKPFRAAHANFLRRARRLECCLEEGFCLRATTTGALPPLAGFRTADGSRASPELPRSAPISKSQPVSLLRGKDTHSQYMSANGSAVGSFAGRCRSSSTLAKSANGVGQDGDSGAHPARRRENARHAADTFQLDEAGTE